MTLRAPVSPRDIGRLLLVFGCALALLTAPPAAPPLHAESAGPSLKGTHTGVLGPVSLHAGLVVLHAHSNGSENFAVDLITQDPSSPVPVTRDPEAFGDFYEMIDATGRCDGARTAILKTDDEYYANVSLVSGPFELTFEQPTPQSVSLVRQTDFSGKGQQVTPYFTLTAGSYVVTARSSNSALRVWLYELDDLGGHAIGSDETGYDEDKLIDTTISPEYTSASVTVPSDGIYLISMNPDGAGSRDWTVSVH
jgi:hypothetical protein